MSSKPFGAGWPNDVPNPWKVKPSKERTLVSRPSASHRLLNLACFRNGPVLLLHLSTQCLTAWLWIQPGITSPPTVRPSAPQVRLLSEQLDVIREDVDMCDPLTEGEDSADGSHGAANGRSGSGGRGGSGGGGFAPSPRGH